MLYLSQMMGKPVVDATGEKIGTISDLAISTGEVFQDVSLVPSMLSKGKLGLFPEGVKDRKSLRRIFDAAASRSKGACLLYTSPSPRDA